MTVSNAFRAALKWLTFGHCPNFVLITSTIWDDLLYFLYMNSERGNKIRFFQFSRL